MKNLEEKKLSSENIFEGKLLNVFCDDVLLPNGNKSKREYIKHCGAVGIIAFTKDNKILLEKQFRYPLHDVIYEIPAGKIDPGEDLLECAKRELLEETGYIAKDWKYLSAINPCVGYSDEIIHFYLAENLEYEGIQLDDDEFLEILEIDINSAYNMIRSGEIKDGKTVSALLFYKFFSENQ